MNSEVACRPPRSRTCVLGALLFAALLAGCGPSPAQEAKKDPPKPPAESDLANVRLTPTQCDKLAVQSEPLQRKSVQEHLARPGWLMVKQGNEVTLTAPVSGYVHMPVVPVPGREIGKTPPLLTIEPVLSPVEEAQLAATRLQLLATRVQLEAMKRDVQAEKIKAEASFALAESELKRQEDLRAKGQGRQYDLDLATAQKKQAAESIKAAEAKEKLFQPLPELDTQTRKPTLVEVPFAGTVLQVHANPGQFVQAAAPLVTIADLSQWWVRVPVLESDLHRLDLTHTQAVVRLRRAGSSSFLPGTPPGEQPWTHERPARFLGLVPRVDAERHTVDLLYELENSGGEHAAREPLARDQLVSVHVPLGSKSEEVVVPVSAVVFDAYAGAWIYLDRTPGTPGTPGDKPERYLYERRRVELHGHVKLETGTYKESDDGVIVRLEGYQPKDRVVTRGAAVLFSREFYKPEVLDQKPATNKDDDDD